VLLLTVCALDGLVLALLAVPAGLRAAAVPAGAGRDAALAAQLLAVAACPARRELRQARWPGAAAADAGRR
jgi:hypothetical protein